MSHVNDMTRAAEARDAKREARAVECLARLESQLQKAQESLANTDAKLDKIVGDEPFARAAEKRLSTESRIKRISQDIAEAAKKLEEIRRENHSKRSVNRKRRIIASIAKMTLQPKKTNSHI